MAKEMSKSRMKVYYLTASAIIMCYMSMIGAIADIAAYFPSYSVQVIQTGVTAINLAIIGGALTAGFLSLKFSKKTIMITGLSFVILGGVCGFLFHDSIQLFYLWSLVIGAGFGMFTPTMTSLLVDYFDGAERNKIAGMQTSFVNGGGVLLTFAGGLLATIAWNYSYLVFLVAVPILIIFARNLPSKGHASAEKSFWHKIPINVVYYAVSIIVFMLLYNVFPSNIALFLRENDLGNASMAGGVNAVFMCGGVFFGFVFTKLSLKIGNYLFVVAHMMLLLCYFTLCHTNSLAVVFVVSFVGGMSISMTMPQALYAVSTKIPPEASVATFAMIASISPNIASFISPVAIGSFSKLLSDAGDSVSRYTAAAILALVFAIAQFIFITLRQRRSTT